MQGRQLSAAHPGLPGVDCSSTRAFSGPVQGRVLSHCGCAGGGRYLVRPAPKGQEEDREPRGH